MKKRGEYSITRFFYLSLRTLIFIRKMKQLKFLTIALILLMGVSLTSCLNSGNDGPILRDGYVHVRSSMYSYFEDNAGNQYYPTTASLTSIEANGGFEMSSSKFVYIQFEYVEDENAGSKKTANGTMTPQKYNINLRYAVALDGSELVTANDIAAMEMVAPETAPVISLGVSNMFLATPFLYDEEILYLPVAFKQENKKESIAKHKIRLALSLEELKNNDKDLVFYVRHDKGDDDKKEVVNISYSGYDIRAAVAAFEATHGDKPKNIIVRVKESGEFSDGMPEMFTEYSCVFENFSVLNKNY